MAREIFHGSMINLFHVILDEIISSPVIPQAVYIQGWEYHRILSFHPSHFKKLFKELAKLGPIEVISKRLYDGGTHDFLTISMKNLFSKLTWRQVQAFIDALDGGYYAVPRKTTIGRIAQIRKVARTTYDVHLRKAESKVVQAVAPYLRLYAATQA